MSKVEYSKEVTNYKDSIYNYAAQDEFLVTITLAEYRELVEFKGKYEAEMRALKLEKYNLETELKRITDKAGALILKYEKGEDDCR